MAVMGTMILVQSIGFHSQFVFRDGMDGSARDFRFKGPAVVAGMKTTQKNGEELSALMEYVKNNEWYNREVVLYGDCPGLAFLLQMPVAAGSAWPDLDSYGYDTFVHDLDHMEQEPVAIIRNVEPVGEQATAKKKYLMDYLEKNDYINAYAGEEYSVYIVQNKDRE